MKADFSGYATKAGLKCSDGRTIMPGAFKHQDKTKVPLVWQHGHNDPKNVLGHALLEHREDGVYAYGFFNDTPEAQHARTLLEHGDINMMSIWANELIQKAGRVLHGAIREVSLVLSGANPGALIENVTIRHGDGEDIELDDEAIIYTGLELEHSDTKEDPLTNQDIYDSLTDDQKQLLHSMLEEALSSASTQEEDILHEDGEDDDEGPTVQEVYDSLNEKQKNVLHFLIGEAINPSEDGEKEMAQSAMSEDGETVADIYNSMTEDQQTLVHFMVGEALAQAEEKGDKAKHDNLDQDEDTTVQENSTMTTRNVFEKGASPEKTVLSHSDVQGIVADATRIGSLKEAVEAYALAHGINDIDLMFPEAQLLSNTPEFFQRRTEWVNVLLGACRKSPFSRIKTISADITAQEARAKGYITGTLKKEEFFGVARRITTPTTIYKKQKLDRDDILDITDFDVVSWLKGEMRLMLDEELARAILVGDGRAVDDEDKINESNIRPIAGDHEVYTTSVYVNIDDSNSSVAEITDAIMLNRHHLRGTGLPTMFTTESYIGKFLTLKDTLGRRIYRNIDELATELRVSAIVPVEVLEEYSDIVAILVNPADYVIGADKGGNVSMFDDFDIDYNQYKYLIETRVSGALTKLKAAMVVKKVSAGAALVVPAAPTFDGSAVTIVNTAGVVYRNAETDAVVNAAGSPYAVAPGDSMTINAEPASSSYYFATSNDDTWTFTNNS